MKKVLRFGGQRVLLHKHLTRAGRPIGEGEDKLILQIDIARTNGEAEVIPGSRGDGSHLELFIGVTPQGEISHLNRFDLDH